MALNPIDHALYQQKLETLKADYARADNAKNLSFFGLLIGLATISGWVFHVSELERIAPVTGLIGLVAIPFFIDKRKLADDLSKEQMRIQQIIWDHDKASKL